MTPDSFNPAARWSAFLAHLQQRKDAIAIARLQAQATDARLTLVTEEWENLAPYGGDCRHHTLCRNAHGDLLYEATTTRNGHACSRERHEVWTESEIADLLESDDGPFNLWDHSWSGLPCGLIRVVAWGDDYLVLPEGA